MSRLDRYQDPELYEVLASEYVLGTMNVRVRRRFKQLMQDRSYLQEAVEMWEQGLYPLTEHIQPIRPPRRVWKSIKREISQDLNLPVGKSTTRLWSNVLLWRYLAVTAFVFCSILVVYELVIPRPESASMPPYVAVLESQDRTPMFVATARQRPSRLIVKMMDGSGFSPDRDLELWCYMRGSSQPWSMGVLARNTETVVPLNEKDWQMIGNAGVLAISAEPMGGSPTGKPSGPIMYEGNFVSLI
ncbi:MAG: anti-sigma factor [Pseudomonadota bacterium]